MTVRPSPHRPAASPALLLSGLIALHTVDGRLVLVNPAQITQVREPLPEGNKGRQITKGVQCVITLTDRSFAAVREDCAKVYHAAETAERGGLAVEKPGKGVRASSDRSIINRSGDSGGNASGPSSSGGGGAVGGGGSAGNSGGGSSGGSGSGGGGSSGGGQGGKSNHGDNGNHGQGNNGNGKGGK